VIDIGRRRPHTRDFCVAISSVMSVVLVWSRLANLGTGFWADEAYSAFYYSGRGPRAIFFDTYVPNNHVLYNLASWVTAGALGRFEASYRIWSVLPALAAVALAAWWAWKRIGPIAATVIVILATVSPVHLILAPQARGYGLAMFAGVVMLIGAVRASDGGETRDVVLFAVGVLVGIWTLPVFALAAVAQAGVLLANPRVRKVTLIACGVIAAASLAFYAPMLGDIVHNAHQRFGAQLAVVGVLTGVYHQLAAPTMTNALPSDPHGLLNQAATFVAIAVLTVAAIVRLARARPEHSPIADRALLAHLTVPIFGTYLALVAGRFYVQPRFASYLLFHVLVLLAIGAQQIWDLVASIAPVKVVAAILIAAVAITGTSRVATVTKDEALLPWENSKFVAEFARSTGLNYVFTDSTHPAALYYYLGEKRVVHLLPAAVKKQSYCAVKSRFIFVDDTYHQTVKPSLKCLLDRRAVRIHVPQQKTPPIRRPGVLTVFLVPKARGAK
jgi:hypothetical protein